MRSALLSLATAALLASSHVSAFKHTSPLLIWSSNPNQALQDASTEITSGVIAADEVYASMSSLGCDWESLVVVHVDELHNSHLASRSLPYPTKADLHLPYLIRPSRPTLDSAVNDWAQICGAEVISGKDVSNRDGEGKKVVTLNMAANDDFSSLSLPSHPHLLLLTGTHSIHSDIKRQERPFPSHTDESPYPSASGSASATPTSSRNSTIPTDGPILDRVQILTTPLITALLVSFFIFLPIVAFGVSALVGIQVPPRMMEIGKGLMVGKEKKDQ